MPVCLVAAQAFAAVLPTEAFSLTWTHSVEQTIWREEWRVEGEALRLAKAAIQGSGAGMEPPPGALLRDGAWVWTPETPPIARLVLANTTFVPDWRLCWEGTCRPLASLLPGATSGPITVYPCDGGTR
jgi:hypothetical protein